MLASKTHAAQPYCIPWTWLRAEFAGEIAVSIAAADLPRARDVQEIERRLADVNKSIGLSWRWLLNWLGLEIDAAFASNQPRRARHIQDMVMRLVFALQTSARS